MISTDKYGEPVLSVQLWISRFTVELFNYCPWCSVGFWVLIG